MERIDISQYTPFLFSIAYNMLGDVMAAEDVVQDVVERWLFLDTAKIDQPKAYLSRMVMNRSIDVLQQLKKERETYKGLWLPEPLLANEQEEHTLEYGILFLLETLNPAERAVFVLKEAFNLAHEEIATMLELNVAHSRQLLHRAREKVRSPRKQDTAALEKQAVLMEAFFVALENGDFNKLREIFLADIVLYGDGGGKMPSALKPIYGMDKVIKFFIGIKNITGEDVFRVEPVLVNLQPGILLYRNDQMDTVMYFEVEGEKLTGIYSLRNPDKINAGLNFGKKI